MRTLLTETAIVSALAFGAAAPALAQQTATTGTPPEVEVVAEEEVNLNEWGYEGLYEDTWTAEQVLDAPVYGPTDEEIGEVENIVVGTNGLVDGIIAEVGGFWDIGDTHVFVPWSEVAFELGEGVPRIEIPVTEATVEDYDLYGGVAGEFRVVDDDNPYTPRAWRASELIDDYVTLEGGARYGWVEDLVFDQAGRLEAVVVDAVYGPAYGPYAYPFYGYGYGFDPGYGYYELPYSAEEVSGLEAFDYGRFETAEVEEDEG